MSNKGNSIDESSEYLTLESECQAILREKMSKFIAIAFPISSGEDAKAKIKKIANDYHDARHVCWAYVAGASGNEYMVNDNGEPSGTAGRPILGQIRSAGLTNVGVAVVRYFGGIKLGTSGLIDAYKGATQAALEAGVKITKTEDENVGITFSYENIEKVMRVLKNSDVTILKQTFDIDCKLKFSIRKDRKNDLLQKISDITTICDVADFT